MFYLKYKKHFCNKICYVKIEKQYNDEIKICYVKIEKNSIFICSYIKTKNLFLI